MDLVFRAAVGFFFILFITRVVGRRELSSMEPFDLILLIVLGDLVQQGITQSDYSVTGMIVVISTIAILTVVVSYAAFRNRVVRRVLEGEPLVLVENGRPIEANLRRERMTLEELLAEARLKEMSSLADVRWALLETNGEISFISK
jgi:uncharacterized membrane protein YcaP (DUF421 family)